MRTLLADFEKLIGIPANNATLETTPAPLDNTRKNHWLGHAQLLEQQLTGEGRILVEKVADEGANGTGVGCGPEGEQEKRDIKCWR